MSDLISRADAISVLDNFTQTDTLGHTPRQIVEALPSAQPERKKGKWLKWESLNGLSYGSICSECGYITSVVPNYGTKYCPNCGADMRDKGDEE